MQMLESEVSTSLLVLSAGPWLIY
uniref:Uncharacterized protein n=1 Tax=Arundo donax TaxID=35708 RepID=A0A0A9FL41_ARUDO